MFATRPAQAARLYRLTGTLQMAESADGAFCLMPGCFRDCADREFPLWLDHGERTGVLCRLSERHGTLHLMATLDPTSRQDAHLLDLVQSGKASGLSFGGKAVMDPSQDRHVERYNVREVSVITWPRRPRFQSEVRIERI